MSKLTHMPSSQELLQKLFLFFTPAEAKKLSDKIATAGLDAEKEVVPVLLAAVTKQDSVFKSIYEQDPTFAEQLQTYAHNLNAQLLTDAEKQERAAFESSTPEIS